ncbi:hypothetical protein [Nocardia rhamnosiphila]
MTARIPIAAGFPEWKIGLLHRMHHHYSLQPISANPTQHMVSGTRAGRRGHDVTATDRTVMELEARAAAAGLPESAIAEARATGLADRPAESSVTAGGVPPPWSAELIDVLADEVWRLQHMALVLAEYDIRSSDEDIRGNLEVITELSRNMDALWTTVTDGIASAGLRVEEARQLWDLDVQGWQHYAQLVHDYDDTTLRIRLDEFASPEIRTQLTYVIDEGSFNRIAQAQRIGIAPPQPIPLSETATEALLTLPPPHALQQDPVWTEGPDLDPGVPLGAADPTTGPDL